MLIRDTQGNGVDALDRDVILSFVLQKPKTWILAHPEYELTSDEGERWSECLYRRKRGEPVAYITGEKEFYGRSFSVHSSTLIPRPATEVLAESAIKCMKGETVAPVIDADTGIVIASNIWGDVSTVRTVADVGTGSGCIGITLACEVPSIRVIATDISPQALRIARKNADRHSVSDRMIFVQGDACAPLADIAEPFLLVSNPPYIPDATTLMKDVYQFEPHAALFGGSDGTDIIKRMMHDAGKHPFCMGVMMECRSEQAAVITAPVSRPI